MMLRQMRGRFVRSAQMASVVLLIAGCAPTAPVTAPTAAPAVKEQPAQPAATAAPAAAPTTSAAQAQPSTSRLVMSVAPPRGASRTTSSSRATWIFGHFGQCTSSLLDWTPRPASTSPSSLRNGSSMRLDRRCASSCARACNSTAGRANSPRRMSSSPAKQMPRTTRSTAGALLRQCIKDIEIVNDYEVVFT